MKKQYRMNRAYSKSGFNHNTDTESADTVSLCAKCKTSGKSCRKCQKAVTKEKRMHMSEDIIGKIDKLLIGEMVVVGGSYINGTTVNVIGSQQTRAHGDYSQSIEIMQQKMPDNKLGVKFNSILGAYVPTMPDNNDNPEIGVVQPDPGDFNDEYIE